MNIDLVKFADWYKARVDKYHAEYGTLAYTDMDDWYCSPEIVLKCLINTLEDYNKDTLAESA